MTLFKKQEGFTIVELLIVIVVIGILATLVIVTFTGIQQKARNTQRQTDIKAIQSHIEAYNAEAGKYPTITNLNDNSSPTGFVQTNLKGLDREAFRDPKSSSYALVGTAASSVYAYDAKDSANGDCNTSGLDCVSYTLTATYEGGGTSVLTGSN